MHPNTKFSPSPDRTFEYQDEELTGHANIELSPDQAVRLTPSG